MINGFLNYNKDIKGENNMQNFVENAKMINNQVIIPKSILKVLGVTNGDYVSFVLKGNEVYIVNPAIYAMKVFQKEMANEARHVNLNTDEDIMKLVKEIRNN